MKYEIAALFCAWILGSDGREEKLCSIYSPEEPAQMSLDDCRNERINLKIIAAQQQMFSIVFCAEPLKEPSADRSGS